MSEPIVPALHFFAPATRLQPGATVRVRLAAERTSVEGVLRAID
jgi:hypothetical protein